MTAWGILHYHGVTQGQSPQDWDLDLRGATAQTRVTTLSHLHRFQPVKILPYNTFHNF